MENSHQIFEYFHANEINVGESFKCSYRKLSHGKITKFKDFTHEQHLALTIIMIGAFLCCK